MYKEVLPSQFLDIVNSNTRSLALLNIDIGNDCDFATSQLYGRRYLDHVFSGIDPNKPQPRNELEQLSFEITGSLLRDYDLGMVLIRPEMFHLSGAVEDFLDEQNFSIIYSGARVVDRRIYSTMYTDVFSKPSALPSLPTRTMVYLSSPSLLIVFGDKLKRFKNESLSDGFCRVYKGREGIQDGVSLRGKLVYTEAVRLGFHTLNDTVLARALDPMFALRNIIQLPGDHHPHSHIAAEKALLKYNAVGIHVPSSLEIQRDLAILNTPCQLNQISDLLKTYEN